MNYHMEMNVMNITANISRIKNPYIRKPLFLLWFPCIYLDLLHKTGFSKNFNEWVKTCFLLGWKGL